MKIFVDPGHGGTDPGAVNQTVGIREADINLDVASRLNQILISRGYETQMSRTSDVYVGLNQRAVMANNWGADYFLSVHCNSVENPSANGTETLYFPASRQSQALAEAVQRQMVLRTNLADRGVIPRNLAVLRLTNMPAILDELAFISNPNEGYLLSTPEFRQTCATAIADGLQQYLQ